MLTWRPMVSARGVKGLAPRGGVGSHAVVNRGSPDTPAAALVALLLVACAPADRSAPGVCLVGSPPPAYAHVLGCADDFEVLAARPLAGAVVGARVVKVVIDRLDGDALYFQDSARYPLHWGFARAHLSGGGRPIVADLARFNAIEYSRPDRRFLLGALVRYDAADVWAFEVAPWDTASPALLALGFTRVAAAAPFVDDLRLHPTSDAVAAVADALPSIPRVGTRELLAATPYQPLFAATAIGRLRFFSAASVEDDWPDLRDVAVFDRVPADLGPVAGLITGSPQTPLSHVNLLAADRGVPNMALSGAFEDPELRALEGRWVELVVGVDRFTLREVDRAAADAWWEENRPPPADLAPADVETFDLVDVDGLVGDGDLGSGELGALLRELTGVYGAKVAHYAALRRVGLAVPVRPAFAVSAAWSHRHLVDHGLDVVLDEVLTDPALEDEPRARRARLAELRAAIEAAPVDPALLGALRERIADAFAGVRVRFRSSTQAEDLPGFSGAGLYTSRSADPAGGADAIAAAVRGVWASLWSDRAFAERAARGVGHRAVAMALLVHAAFVDERANGVALTANPLDPERVEPAFYISVQRGDIPVVAPPPGVTSDDVLYYFTYPSQPVVTLARSNLTPGGAPVLSRGELFAVGEALHAIHGAFEPVYLRAGEGFAGMDVEFEVVGPASAPRVWVKQARPAPWR